MSDEENKSRPKRRSRFLPRRAARPSAFLGLGAPLDCGGRAAGPPLLRLASADAERSLGPLRAQRRGHVAPRRPESLPCREPGPPGCRQLAAAPQRSRSPPAPVLVDSPWVQTFRASRVGGPFAARALGAGRRPRDVRVRRTPVRPPYGDVRGRRAIDDAALLRTGPVDARRDLHDVGSGDGVWWSRCGDIRPRRGRAGADARDESTAVAGNGGGGPFRWLRKPGRSSRTRRAVTRGWPGVGGITGFVDAGDAGRNRGCPGGRLADRGHLRQLRWLCASSPAGIRKISTSGWEQCSITRPTTRPSTFTSQQWVMRWPPGAHSFPLRSGDFSLRLPPARGSRPSVRASRASLFSWGPPLHWSRTDIWQRGRTSLRSAGPYCVPWRAPSRFATSSAGRMRRSRWGSARCCWPRSSTTTSTSFRRRRTRPSALRARRSRRVSRRRRSTCGGSCWAALLCVRS